MQITSEDKKAFMNLFEKVARWVATEYGFERMEEMNAGNFPMFLDSYHNAMALAIARPEFRKEVADRIYKELNKVAI